MARRMVTGCRDCRRCGSSGAVDVGRAVTKGTLAFFTFGMSAAAAGLRRKCGQCRHKMKFHGGGTDA